MFRTDFGDRISLIPSSEFLLASDWRTVEEVQLTRAIPTAPSEASSPLNATPSSPEH